MKDLASPFLIKLKAVLFVLCGGIAAALLLVQMPSLSNVALLLIVIWSFCRAYYFLFYVVEHYVNPGFKYAGLFALLRACWQGKGPM